MAYMGSKSRIAKHLLPIILENRTKDQFYVEPFVGGGNTIIKVEGNRIGNDINSFIIALLKAVRDGWIPPKHISREEYYDIKKNIESVSPQLYGFIGYGCSFGGRWWGGYAHNNGGDNYAQYASNTLIRLGKKLIGADLRLGHYADLMIPPNSIIYCDPPYADTHDYGFKMDYSKFWQWCRDQTKIGHTVFVSEYNAPDDFVCVKTVETYTSMNKNNRQYREEKLWQYKK